MGYQVSSVVKYHHGTPQYIKKDLLGLSKKPKHLSVILKLEENHRTKADVERLLDEVAEIATWCACAEIPMLSVYEKTGTCLTCDFFSFILTNIRQGSLRSTCLESAIL